MRGLQAEAEAAPSKAATPAESLPLASAGTTGARSAVSGGTTRPRPARAGADGGDDLPTANDLRLQGFLTGPPLHLDLHVFYPESHRRVVFISGTKYREGDQVANGPVVREIVPEGVILEERGRRYLLMPD